MIKSFIVTALAVAALTETYAEAPTPLQAVPSVDLERYVGRWYEIARFPQKHQENCDQAEANYEAATDGSIRVRNTCIDTKDGSKRQVEGVAEVVDRQSNAKLKVSFVPVWMRWTGIGRGDYWVIDLATDYSYAVVSEPQRKYLWILSRTPQMQKSTYEEILGRLSANHFDLTRLIPARTNHTDG